MNTERWCAKSKRGDTGWTWRSPISPQACTTAQCGPARRARCAGDWPVVLKNYTPGWL